MRPLSTLIASFAGSIACASLAVSAFSPTPHHRITSSLPGDGDVHRRKQPLLCQRKIAKCNHSNRSSVRYTQLLSTNNDAAELSSASNLPNTGYDYYEHLLAQFQGDFDNYNQVVQDRKHGLTPGEGGGHENIHCTLVPCPQKNDVTNNEDEGHHLDTSQWVLAAFYFNGNPRQIFRFRAYELTPPSSDDLPVRMKLNTILPHLEQQLRKCSDQPDMWWKEVWNVWRKDKDEVQDCESIISSEELNQLRNEGLKTIVTPLEGCDVLWDPNWDPEKHAYLYDDEYNEDGASIATEPPSMGQSYHATMEAGSKGAIVDSISLIPGKRILIKDELSLWKDEFWINDRGYDPDAIEEGHDNDDNETDSDSEKMPFVYGNRRGVPYKLQRVANFVTDSENGNDDNDSKSLPAVFDTESCLSLERKIDNSELEWTLGEDYRTSDLFEEKMQVLAAQTKQ